MKEVVMQPNTSDQLSIMDLMNGWMYRDLGDWDNLRTLFHPDGSIEVTWFEGQFADFVDASIRMGASDLRTKHVIGSPVLKFNGPRAIAETNAIIVGENVNLDVGCSVHSRFYDLLEKRHDVWKLVKRHCLYDMGTFNFPRGIVELDVATIQRYPREYAPLAYLLEKSGFPVTRVFPTKGSDQERTIKASALTWLMQ